MARVLDRADIATYRYVNGEMVPLTNSERDQHAQDGTAALAEADVVRYIRARQRAYPSPGDQLDVVWKVLKQLDASGIEIGEGARDMLAKIDAVKNRYPKTV